PSSLKAAATMSCGGLFTLLCPLFRFSLTFPTLLENAAAAPGPRAALLGLPAPEIAGRKVWEKCGTLADGARERLPPRPAGGCPNLTSPSACAASARPPPTAAAPGPGRNARTRGAPAL